MEFLKKYGILILIVIGLLTFLSTCGSKSKIDRLDKKVQVLTSTIQYNDSLNNEIRHIEQSIATLQVSKEILYSWNSVVRTTNRPDDLMNQYDQKIKELQVRLDKLKDVKRK